MKRSRKSLSWALTAFVLVGLVGVWAVFALTPDLTRLMPFGLSQGKSVADGAAPSPVDPALKREGQGVYTRICQSCHQANGRGLPSAFPPLAGNPILADTKTLVQVIRKGKTGPVVVEGQHFNGTMPPIGAQFSNRQVAAVCTYVRNSWGNHFGGVSEADVARAMSGS